MKLLKIFSLLLLSFSFSCGAEKTKKDYKISLNSPSKKYQLGEKISFEVKGIEPNQDIKLKYKFQKLNLESNSPKGTIKTKGSLLGVHELEILLTVDGKIFNLKENITLLNNASPEIYGYKIINTYPHNEQDFTQGLEFKGDRLFESTGHYKKSKLLEKDLKTGKTLKTHNLSDDFFGEGLTIVGNKIHQLTWRGNFGYTYDINSFKQLGTFAYNKSKQGWGICFDGSNTIYKSDGTTKIWKLDATSLKEIGYIQITTNKALKSRFNELEWVDGKIYANTWQKDSIAIINPENGAIEAIINLKGIREKVGVEEKDNSKVLNGIAYKANSKQLYITGKYWSSLFEIEVTK